MLMYFDFECPECNRAHEAFVQTTEESSQCPYCPTTAKRVLSAVRIDKSRIATTANASPESIAHFDRLHKQQKAIEEKTYREHGDYGKAPGSD